MTRLCKKLLLQAFQLWVPENCLNALCQRTWIFKILVQCFRGHLLANEFINVVTLYGSKRIMFWLLMVVLRSRFSSFAMEAKGSTWFDATMEEAKGSTGPWWPSLLAWSVNDMLILLMNFFAWRWFFYLASDCIMMLSCRNHNGFCVHLCALCVCTTRILLYQLFCTTVPG